MIKSVAFAGLGAVGAIYAQKAVRCEQVPCVAVVRDKQSYMENPVYVNGERLNIPMVTPQEAEEPVDLLLIAVKWHTLEEVLEQAAPFIAEGTIILSLLNGISSEQVIRTRFPQARVLPAMCSGVDSNRVGRNVRMNRRGRIVFGAAGEKDADAAADVAAYFDQAQIPYEMSADMLRQMWWKLMVNVGMNQVSAVTNLDYEGVRTNPQVMEQMHRAQREVIAIANALGISLDENDIETWDRQLDTLCCCGLSSTLQDIRARRKTEVELYGETICRMGKSLGIETPENARLAEEIRRIEQEYL